MISGSLAIGYEICIDHLFGEGMIQWYGAKAR